MARYNRRELLRSLQHYRHNLDVLLDLIEQEDWVSLEQQLKSTQLARPLFIRQETGDRRQQDCQSTP